MYELTGSPVLVGALTSIRGLSVLLAGPIGGVLTDRMDRRKAVMRIQLTIGLLALVFAMLVASNLVRVWHLFAFSLLSGGCQAMVNPMRRSMLVNSVPREEIMNAVALDSTMFHAVRSVGPALAGLLIALTGPAVNFFLQAACALGVATLVFPVRVPQADVTASRSSSMLTNFRDGLRYAAREPTILALLIFALAPTMFIMPFTNGIMPVFAVEVLSAGPRGLGLLLGAMGLGAFVGVVVLATAGNVSHKGRILLTAATATGVATIAFSFTRDLPVSLLVLVGVGASQQLYVTTTNATLQTVTDDAYRGRVMSLYMLDHGLVLVGGLLAGVLAQVYGAAWAILIGGTIATTLVVAMGVRLRALRQSP